MIPGCGREVYETDNILLYRTDIADIAPNREWKQQKAEERDLFTASTTTNFHHTHCLLVWLYTYGVLTNTCIIIIIVIYTIFAIAKVSDYF